MRKSLLFQRVKEIAVYCFFFSLFFLPTLPSLAQEAPSNEAATPPNILVFMLDDLDEYSFEVLQQGGWIPNIQRYLLDKGTIFENSFVTNAVCCPSRATFLSGQYTKNHGVLNVGVGLGFWMNDGEPDGENDTIATWLQTAGYRTGHIGKYLNGYGYVPGTVGGRYVPPGYEEWYTLVDPSTYRVFNYTISENGNPVSYGNDPFEYQTDVLGDYAVAFLKRSSELNDGRPFYLSVMPIAPHIEVLPENGVLNRLMGYRSHYRESIRPAPRHLHLVDGDMSNGELPEHPLDKPSFSEWDMSDKPFFMQSLPELNRRDIAAVQQQFKERLASVIAVDDLIGRVMATLEGTGQLNNTLVVFTSDNGYFFGEHRLSSKLYAYEESIRVPLIVRRPGAATKEVCAKLALNIDLAPTLAAVGGAQPTRVVDGRSLQPLLSDSAGAFWPRKRFMVEHFAEPPAGALGIGDLSPVPYKAIRQLHGDQDELFVEWYQDDESIGGVSIAVEHYNLKVDTFQLENNIFSLPWSKLQAFEERLEAFSQCRGESCRALEE